MVCAGTNSNITTATIPAPTTTPVRANILRHAIPPSIIITNITPARSTAVERFSPTIRAQTSPVSPIIFQKVLMGTAPSAAEIEKFRSAFLFDQGVMDAEAGWAQQYHVGPIRNNNTKMFREAGPDTGYDAIHDLEIAADGHRFFDRLTLAGKLAKTILYCLNPKDNAVMMAMAYTFNDGTFPGKMQFGSGWWFLDQEVGMRRQLDSLSHLGLLSRFVGMLTDSRSFISYPRHEYFRRILCDVLGQDVEQGKLPASELDFIGRMVEDISYNNAKNYFNF